MFISNYKRDTPMCETVSKALEELEITFKKELFQFENTNDIIMVAREHINGEVVCACKILMDSCNYKLEKITFKKQLALIFCLESMRTSIILENFKMFENKETEFRIFWNNKLLKDNVIEQIAKLVDLHPEKNEYYVLNQENYLCFSGNDIELKKEQKQKKAFEQNVFFNNGLGSNSLSSGGGLGLGGTYNDPFKTSSLFGSTSNKEETKTSELKFGTSILAPSLGGNFGSNSLSGTGGLGSLNGLNNLGSLNDSKTKKEEPKTPELKFGTSVLGKTETTDNKIKFGTNLPSLFDTPLGKNN